MIEDEINEDVTSRDYLVREYERFMGDDWIPINFDEFDNYPDNKYKKL